MIRQLSWRLMQAFFVVLSVGLLTWFLVRSLPGDMAWRIASGRYGYDRVDADAVARVQQELSGAADQAGLTALAVRSAAILWSLALVSGEPVMNCVDAGVVRNRWWRCFIATGDHYHAAVGYLGRLSRQWQTGSAAVLADVDA
ncbi:hypothetical protein LZ023_36010 (plasmid) [Pseudomonas silvicola]|nr:hypothetical protein LZ023_36010 [Pseudomonas silvicola]